MAVVSVGANHRRRVSTGAAVGAAGLAVLAVLAGCGGSAPAPGPTGSATSPPAGASSRGPSAGSSSDSSPPTGAPVPLLFTPSSVSFVDVTTGFALGISVCAQGGGPAVCTGLAGTRDGGRHWTALAAPPFVDLADPAHQPIVHFVDRQTGFVTDGRPGTGLLVTRDGGRSWAHLDGLPAGAAVTAVATGDRNLLVVAGDRTARRMWVGTVDGRRLDAVGPALAGTGGVVDVTLAGEAGYVVSSPAEPGRGVSAYRSVGLASWTSMATPCGTSTVARVAATGDRVLLGCQDAPTGADARKEIFVSTDAGDDFSRSSGLGANGRLAALAVGSAETAVVATTSDTDTLQASRNGARTFTVTYASAVGGVGQGLHDVEFVDARHAFAVLGSSGSYAVALAAGQRNVPGSRLLATDDGGQHWTQIQIRP